MASSKSNSHSPIVEPVAVQAPVVARPKCTQCGKTMAHLPFFIDALTCRECYGAERYKRVAGATIGGRSFAAPLASEDK